MTSVQKNIPNGTILRRSNFLVIVVMQGPPSQTVVSNLAHVHMYIHLLRLIFGYLFLLVSISTKKSTSVNV